MIKVFLIASTVIGAVILGLSLIMGLLVLCKMLLFLAGEDENI